MRSTLVEIPVTVRRERGKNAARQLRKGGLVPAVIYGRGVSPRAVAVEEAAFLAALPRGAWQTTPVRLLVKDAEGGAETIPAAMVAEVQQNALARKIYAIDFHVVSLEDRVHVQVPVRAVGESPGVKQGGLVEMLVHELTVEARPGDIPEHLQADISALGIRDSVRVKDLALPEGVKVLAPAEETILVIAAPAKLELPEEAAAAPVEAAEPEVVRPEPETEE